MQVLIHFQMRIQWQFIKKFLKGKLNFRKVLISKINNFNLRNAKSLVKHLLVADLSKRYGNLKNGY